MGHGQWAIGQGTGSLGRGRQLLQADGTEVKGDDALLTSYLWTADGPPKTLPSTGLAHAIRDQESQPLLSRLSDSRYMLCTYMDTSSHASTVTPLPFAALSIPEHVTSIVTIISIIIITTTWIQAQPCRPELRVRPIAVGGRVIPLGSTVHMTCRQ